MSREKLNKLGLDLPLLPTTSVGSFPKPGFLKKARAEFSKGNIGKDKLKANEENATAFWIREQEKLGIDVLVDGEMYRGDMVAYFADGMDGFSAGGLVRSYGNRFYHKPIIKGKVGWKLPITVGWWKFAQNMTPKPVKGMLTGPYTIMDWSFIEYYRTRKEATLALAAEIRKEVLALVEAGAKIIQIDEPAVSVRPEELPIAIEAMGLITDGVPAYFITHICYGAFEKVYPNMLDMPVDNFDLEMSNSGLDMLETFKKQPFTKDISFGVVDVHSHKIETKEVVKTRLKEAMGVLKPETIWVDPDCGLKTRSVDEARDKLKVLSNAVKDLRR